MCTQQAFLPHCSQLGHSLFAESRSARRGRTATVGPRVSAPYTTVHLSLNTARAKYCTGAGYTQYILGKSSPSATLSTPIEVGNSTAAAWAFLAAGDRHVCGLDVNRKAYCFGSGLLGQLGNGYTNETAAPRAVSSDRAWLLLSAGSYRTCGVTFEWELYCWGENFAAIPVKVPNPSSGTTGWKDVSAGLRRHMCAITRDGSAYCLGEEQLLKLCMSP